MPSLLHRDICIGNFQANLILELLAPYLALADLQFVAKSICLRDAISLMAASTEANAVGREVIPEDLPKSVSKACRGNPARPA